jgi:V8-like Glu-specific endopeptidase
MFKSLLIAAAVVFVTSSAFAFPLPKISSVPNSKLSIQALPAGFTADYNFAGIVALSNCSGSIIRFETSKSTDHAMILTNGHCKEGGFARPGEFTYGVQSSRTFAIMNANAEDLGQLHATQIVYSTMTSTDITLYKLSETFSEISSQYAIEPLTLASKHPELNTPIEVISGYWRRGYACNIEAFVPALHEGEWIFNDSIRYSRPGCEIIGGTSGSPIIIKGTRTMVGINNTINENGESCTLNNPCEVDAQGNIKYQLGYGYGQQTAWIYTCLNSNNEVDLATKGCVLLH